MRRTLTALVLASALGAAAAPAASADPACPPTLRAYPSADHGPGDPEDPSAFGQRMAFFAQGGGSDFGEQVSREAHTRVPCP